MKLQFQIGEKIYDIKDLTLRNHYQIQNELKLNPKPQVQIISMLSGCPKEELYDLDLDQFVELWIGFEQYYENLVITQAQPPKEVNLGDKQFALLDLQKIRVGEFADLDILISGPEAENRIHEMLAVIYRPVIEKTEFGYVLETYDGPSSKKRAEQFQDLDLNTAMKGVNFFLGIGKDYLSSTLNSLKEMAKEETDPWIKGAIEMTLKQMPEDGLISLLFSPGAMFWNWTERLNSVSTLLSTGWDTSRTKRSDKKESFKVYKNYELVTWQ